MKTLLGHLDEIPVTLLVALAYVTLAFLTDPFHPTGEQLDAYGWLTPLLAAHGEPWRMLTSAFLHGGIVHLVFNMSMLLGIGPALERSLGSLRFAALYLASALGGSIAVCLLYDVGQPVIGGSGALFGMMGALLAMNMRSGRHVLAFLDFEGPRRLLAMIAVNLLIGWLLPFVSNTAHIGGLCLGFLVTFQWLRPGAQPTAELRAWRLAGGALFASLFCASLWPVTRYDWLWNRSLEAPPATSQALRRAAAMAFFQQHQADDGDVERMRTILFPPQDADSPPQRRRGG